MSFTDPIADMLTRIRNAVLAGHAQVAMPNSKIKVEIAKILKDEGFLEGFEVVDGEHEAQKVLRVKIKYVGERRQRRAVLSGLERVSKPGRRIYTKRQTFRGCFQVLALPLSLHQRVSWPGVRARQLGVGGEIICKVW